MPAVHWVAVIVLGTGRLMYCWPRCLKVRRRSRGHRRNIVRIRIQRFANLAESIVREKVEELVFDHRSAARTAELLLLVRWLRQQESLNRRIRLVVERVVLVSGSSAFSVG